tara:strand:+ start:720 stop:974 length:255 start_codon:yes stop_codon:yes gene_type:complete
MTISKSNHKLTLYHFDMCPFCVKVKDFMDQNNIQIPMKNILMDSQAKAELLEIGGNTQVPCLVIDGKALYESDDIIEWLQQHFV